MSTNDYLAAVAVKHGFQDYLEVSHRDIRNQIQGFIAAQNKKGHDIWTSAIRFSRVAWGSIL